MFKKKHKKIYEIKFQSYFNLKNILEKRQRGKKKQSSRNAVRIRVNLRKDTCDVFVKLISLYF